MHALLRRQLRKLGVSEDFPTPEQWRLFLDRVGQTYAQSDQDRYMLERSLEQCSVEMQTLYDQLARASAAELAKKSVELEASLALANAIQDSVMEGIVLCDGDVVLRHNRLFAEMWQMPDAELEPRTVTALLEHMTPLVKAPLALKQGALLDESSAHLPPSDVELEDGRVFARYVAPVRLGGTVVGVRIVCFRDVTEERRVAAQRGVVAERMASVGQLVASVAHEINNPLAFVKGNLEFVAAELALRGDTRDLPLVEALEDSDVGVDRIAVIVRDLKLLSRVDDERRASVDVTDVLESALQLANNQIRHRATVVRKLASIPPVMANEGKLVQVFLNLLVNAAQAIPEGRAGSNEIVIETTSAAGSGVVRILVRDSGAGIAPELLERIFDPFFTTKAVGSGTGLGLSICKGIVETLGGTISVSSRLGQGTAFVIELPIGDAKPTVDRDSGPPLKAHYLRILVVDDEPMARRMLARTLRGHAVVAVASVDEALATLGAVPPFDLILCDVMMPERTGLEMHAEVTRRWPELLARLVFMSGGAFTPALQAFLEQPSIQRLDKPVTRRALNDLVARMQTIAVSR
jgi:signal transduction histidine kinase